MDFVLVTPVTIGLDLTVEKVVRCDVISENVSSLDEDILVVRDASLDVALESKVLAMAVFDICVCHVLEDDRPVSSEFVTLDARETSGSSDFDGTPGELPLFRDVVVVNGIAAVEGGKIGLVSEP